MPRTKRRRLTVQRHVATRTTKAFCAVTWHESVTVAELVREFRNTLRGYVRLILRGRNKKLILSTYDAYASNLRRFCRLNGLPCPRLSHRQQFQVTQIRRASAVLAKLKGK